MNYLQIFRFSRNVQASSLRCFSSEMNNQLVNSPNNPELIIAKPKRRLNETLLEKKSRLIYQSRKRGMLENDLLISTFTSKYLNDFDEKQITEFDRLINEPSNDWDIYNWATGKLPTPKEYDGNVFQLFKEHVKNIRKEQRFQQPPLY